MSQEDPKTTPQPEEPTIIHSGGPGDHLPPPPPPADRNPDHDYDDSTNDDK